MKNLMHCVCSAKWGSAAPLLLRLAVGLIFAIHGWTKITMMGIPGVSAFLASLGFPMPDVFAVLLMAAEFGGGIALILGLWTHWAGKILAFVALVAYLAVYVSHGVYFGKGDAEALVLLFAAAASLMITGPGKWSLDHAMKK